MADAPVDPRLDPPAFGSMPTVARVDEVASRVIAPNASPMTLDGTNTYGIDAGVGRAALVLDPGPDDPAHRRAVDALIADRDLSIVGVVVTHHHADHAAAAAAWARSWAVPVIAASAEVAGPDGRVVAAGDQLAVDELRIRVIETPGHTQDSISLRLPTGSVCTGDHILGRGTTVVAHPDGTLTQYLDSLRRLLDLGPAALLPGHGPHMTQDPAAVLRFHLAHRAFRLDQIRDVVRRRPATAVEVVAVLYAAYPPVVWPAATTSTLAGFDHLVLLGEAVLEGDRLRLLAGAS
jgi:glyoxylase-like metal-dependent hydrolase (beta-lactamase superfamily II)